MELVWVDVDRIKPNRYNPNVMDDEAFEALCDFMRSHSAEEVDPIWVRKDGVDEYGQQLFEIIDGEHRWKAAKKAGWRRLRAWVLDVDEDYARAFNVRKNRERGKIDAIKFGKILFEEHERGATLEELAKKYGYSSHSTISDYIKVYENREAILANVDGSTPIGIKKALRILRELKKQEKAEAEQKIEEKPETEKIVEEMVEEYAPAIEKVYSELPKYNKRDPERNRLVLNMLLKNLEQGLVFCPVCGQQMFECSHCHTSLKKMKEENKL